MFSPPAFDPTLLLEKIVPLVIRADSVASSPCLNRGRHWLVPRRGPPRLSIFTLKSATWRACGHALDLPRARSAAPLLQNLIVCCCCAIQAPRRPGLGSRGVRRRSIPRSDMLFEPFQPALCEREARHLHEIGACLITDCRPRMWQLNLTGKHDLFGPGSRALRVRFGCACQPGDRALCRARGVRSSRARWKYWCSRC